MKLQSKLVLSFGVMLILVAVTTASGWFSSNDITRVAKHLAAVDNSMFALQRAQLSMLRYTTYKEKRYADDTVAQTKESLALVESAVPFIKNPEQKKRVEGAIAGVKEFAKSTSSLISSTQKCLELTQQMVKLSTEVSKTSADLLALLENNIRDNYTSDRLRAFSLINQADSYFYFTRLRVSAYMADPTPEKAQEAQRVLAETRRLAAEGEKLLTVPANKQAVLQAIIAFDTYGARLTEYSTITNAMSAQTDTVRTQGTQISKQVTEISDSAEKLMAASQSNGNTTNYSVLLIAVLIGVGITLLLTKNVTRQLGKDPGELAIIAKRVTDGDYDIDDGSARMGVYDNIIAMVAALKNHIENAKKATEQAQQESARALEAMQSADAASKDAQAKRDSILVAADKLEEVAHVVSSAAEELSAQIEQSERGATEQASRASETATAMEQMNSTVLEVARNAANANNGGKEMRVKATEGAAVVDSSVRGVQKARADALELKEDMNTLSEQAQSIGQIMNVISDIADQTNLLALNAAIEAARAGEAGRGFAVVADEVRKLAEKTMKSTTDVGNAITSIQASAAKNMSQVDATVKNIEFSTEEAEKSGQALREIVEMIDTAVAQISSIATASEEQSATSEQINRSVSQVNSIASETARAMQEAAQAVSDLSGQAQVLTRLIEDMKKG